VTQLEERTLERRARWAPSYSLFSYLLRVKIRSTRGQSVTELEERIAKCESRNPQGRSPSLLSSPEQRRGRRAWCEAVAQFQERALDREEE